MPSSYRHIHWFLILWFLILILTLVAPGMTSLAHAASPPKSFQSMDIQGLNRVDQIKAAVQHLKSILETGDQENPSPFITQKTALLKIGECIGKLSSLSSGNNLNQEALKTHSTIRDILKNVIDRNEALILYFQDHKLDKMVNPAEFFKSAEWQNPHDLISLASYGLGWNGYYGGLLSLENSAEQTEWLQEAVKGFSRSFIDFEEEDVVLRSLLGRALCQSKLKAYDSAKKDLSSVKKRLKKQDPLYLRCLYEECRILYVTGNLDLALRTLEEIQEDYSPKDFPPEIAKGFDQLKGKILLGVVEKPAREDQKPVGKIIPNQDKLFSGLRQLAEQPSGVNEFYRYTRDNADRMRHLANSDLGPVGALGMGDIFFERTDYDKALNYYLFVVSESPKRLEGKLDRVGFRIATIHFLKKNFSACLPVLKDFHKKYRDSPLMEQAIPLYYLAASNHYGQARDQNAYRQFIEAAGVYVTQCRGNCPELSEARFHLGQHYEKTGAFEQAVKEFSRVGKDSPHFAVANYHVLKHYVKQLEDIKRAGRFPSEESQRIFRESLKGVQKEQDLTLNKKQTSALKSLAPHMAVLLAKRLTFDETPPNEEILARLRLFETLYPKEEMLFPEVFQLRVHCYFNLDQTEPMRKEISDFASSKPITKVRYDALKNLARDFYLQSKAGENGGQTEASEKSARAALLIYQQLYSLSLNHPDFRDHCDALQLRMAQIHIDNNQLDSAEVLYREILNRNSLSADAFYSLGLLYEKKEQWEDALATWRQFSDGVKEGTFHWYESRYKIARAHMKLGHSQKACEILTITLVLHPDLGNDTLAGQYQDLKNDVCQGGS